MEKSIEIRFKLDGIDAIDFFSALREGRGSLYDFNFELVVNGKVYRNNGNLLQSVHSALYHIGKDDKKFYLFDDGNRYSLQVKQIEDKVHVKVKNGNATNIQEEILNADDFYNDLFDALRFVIDQFMRIETTNTWLNDFIKAKHEQLERIVASRKKHASITKPTSTHSASENPYE